MKLSEDKEIKIQEPAWSVGSFKGSEPFPSPGEFVLVEIKEIHPPRLELVFKSDGQSRSGWIEPKTGSAIGASRLGLYSDELQNKLKGKTWENITNHNFTFGDASRML